MRLSPRTERHAVVGAPPPGRYIEADGTVVRVEGAITRLGRSLTADVEIEDPSVSRRHALIVHDGGVTYLLDDGSRNGTWHNGTRVERAVLHDGDEVALGTARLRYVTSHGGRPAALLGKAEPSRDVATGGRNTMSA